MGKPILAELRLSRNFTRQVQMEQRGPEIIHFVNCFKVDVKQMFLAILGRNTHLDWLARVSVNRHLSTTKYLDW